MDLRILLATDGSDAALGAVHVALALARRQRAAVEAVTVFEPLSLHGVNNLEATAYIQRQLLESGQQALRERVTQQLAGAGAASWPLSVEAGSAAPTIVRVAREKDATVIVLGLGRHDVADRWFGSETALRVMHLAHVPVLAVPAGTRCLPQTAVAAVDFSDFSRDAAEAALQVVHPEGTLHLVHVLPKPFDVGAFLGDQDWPEYQRQLLQGQLEELEHHLKSVHGIKVETHFLEGDAAGETLHLAEALSAGLIAAGSHGAGFFSRLLMGSVSTRVVRGATCMVLIAPPRTVPAGLEEPPGEATVEAVAAKSVGEGVESTRPAGACAFASLSKQTYTSRPSLPRRGYPASPDRADQSSRTARMLPPTHLARDPARLVRACYPESAGAAYGLAEGGVLPQ
jgi:nucleotide-binding universal stress UspA family protein